MREHCTGFVPACKRNVRVLNTGTKREVKRRLPAGAAGQRRDQRMNDLPSPAEAGFAKAGGAHAQRRSILRLEEEGSPQRRRDAEIGCSASPFASPRSLILSDAPHAQRRSAAAGARLARARAAMAVQSISSDAPHAQRRRRWKAHRSRCETEQWSPCPAGKDPSFPRLRRPTSHDTRCPALRLLPCHPDESRGL